MIDAACLAATTVATDEWVGYNHVGRRHGRTHRMVDHSEPKCTWAIDMDGDGRREVHCNTMEAMWTGLRNFLRSFRSVGKWSLAQYVAIFQCGCDLKKVTDNFMRVLLGIPSSTCPPP